ncbi:PE-PPE domain-containing protein [Corynebacterium crudilactis]|uniref:Uncharacterized protein n=1 Tax=Corynebacterium crudilactis TaxID=1652495 RepID=A0A172QV46_9CORY|nr:PE-PPE domain-containing protein [Corynebacterium crudilactis]ANE04583.1 hypothetical protein ccrud_10460 [Corynebacterium crudilactis]
MSVNKLWKLLASVGISAALIANTPVASAQSSGLSSGSSTGSLSAGSSNLWNLLFPEDHASFIDRLLDPLDDSFISIHPDLDPDLYEEVFDPPQVGECPAVVAVVARGSGQNMQIRPARYSEDAPWTSNGFEERNFRSFFGRLESYYQAKTGESLMKDVYVMGLNNVDYPAVFPLSSEGSSLLKLGTSVSSGRENIMSSIDRFETTTGCTPKYLLAGYSQGVLIVDGQEDALIARDQYVGTLHIANPSQDADDPSIVGHQVQTGGIASSLKPSEDNPFKISYCLPGDIVCDRSFEQFSAAGSSMVSAQLSTGDTRPGGVHLQYFVTTKPWDEEIFEEVSSWITESVNS